MSFSQQNRQKSLEELVKGTNRHNAKERRKEVFQGLKALAIIFVISVTFVILGGLIAHWTLFGSL